MMDWFRGGAKADESDASDDLLKQGDKERDAGDLTAALLLAWLKARPRAGKESEIPNFKGSSLGRFPLVLANSWTSDHLLERS